jgi:sterol desaturase/sphingolipid hydroxylase (fatty acid hydroxylase superfamily)
MRASYIALAVPFFFVLIAVELAVARARGRRVYRLGDALSDLGCGMVQQVALVFLAGAVLAGYERLYAHRLVTWDGEAAPWIIAFVGVDFLYYWWHRMSHEVNVLWAAHVVHHQSEDYNLAVALRQAILTSFTAQIFYVWLALLGVPVLVFASVNAISTLYQFWIHTELVGKLGRAETFLNTPSAHRVHHAINPRYLDKNYGAIFIVWDRIFGTYEPETEPCVYGVVKPLGSYNPLWAQVQPLVALASASAAAPRVRDKIRIWLAPPGWTPAGVAPPADVADGSYVRRPKYDPRAPRPVQRYAAAQFAIAVLATAALMFTQETAPRPLLAAGAALVVLTLATAPGLAERRPWAPGLEYARLAVVALGAAAWTFGGPIFAPAVAGAAAYAAASALWLWRAGVDAVDPGVAIRAP